jgi:hypothetical protein
LIQRSRATAAPCGERWWAERGGERLAERDEAGEQRVELAFGALDGCSVLEVA